MMLALGASLCSASPCRQVDAHKEELPSVLPVKIFLSFSLLNFLSLPLPPFPWLLSLFLILSPLLAFIFLFAPVDPSCVCCALPAAALPLWVSAGSLSPAVLGARGTLCLRPGHAWASSCLLRVLGGGHRMAQNDPAVEPPVPAPVTCCRGETGASSTRSWDVKG